MPIIPLSPDTESVSGVVDNLAETVENGWPVIDSDARLDDDGRADATRLFEQVEEAIAELRKIPGISSEVE